MFYLFIHCSLILYTLLAVYISIYEGHFYVRRIGLYLNKYRIYGTISIYILKGLAFVYQLI